jgi:hypothetical protein
MSASDWVDLLADSSAARDLYDTAPPLSSCSLFYFHIDEREVSVTLGFSTTQPPTHPPARWVEKGHNTLEFYLLFSGVEALRVAGWNPPACKNFSLESQSGDVVAISITSDGCDVAFQARRMSLTRTRSYTAAFD